MALVTITDAIKLSGVSRPTFYRKHIGDKADSKNRVTVQIVGDRKMIDTSELERVFGSLNLSNETVSGVQQENATGKDEPDQSTALDSLRQQLEDAKQRELKLEERELWYQQQIAEEKARAERAEVKLLAYQEPTSASDPVQEEIAELRESLRELSARRWWQVWK